MNKILLACKTIAKEFELNVSDDFKIQPNESVSSIVFRFCEQHQIGVREIDLKGYRISNEPMIGFLHGEPFVCKEKIPKDVSGPIFSFYRPLPETVHSPIDLIRFGLKGKMGLLIPILFLSFFSAAFSLFPLFSMNWVIYRIELQGTVPYFSVIVFALLFSAFGAAFFLYMRNRAVLRLDGLLASCMDPPLWNRFFNLKISFFRKVKKGTLIHKALIINKIREDIGKSAASSLFLSILALMYLIAMSHFSPIFTLISLVPISAFFFIFIVLFKKRSLFTKEIHLIDGEMERFLEECFHSIIRIRASKAENRAAAVWQKKFDQKGELLWKKEKIRIAISVAEFAFPILSIAVVVAFWIFSWNLFLISDVFPFLVALLLLTSTAYELAFSFFEAFSSYPAIQKKDQLFMEPVETGTIDPGRLSGAIAFQNVSFRYGEGAPLLFDDLTLSIGPKEKIGILGEAGKGRSTLIRLLLGFETAEKGVILLDGKDLSTLKLKQVRRQLGTVFGSEGIYTGSIFENIDAGRGSSQEEIQRALKQSGFEKEIRDFPMGLHTLLTEGGETLSETQRQKLLLARALAFDPAILLIDEGIDHLDFNSKEEIFAHLRGISATQVIISQDEALLKRFTDKIYRLEHGKLLE